MAVQFGRWNFGGVPSDSEYVKKVSQTLSPYGPDGTTSYSNGGVAVLYSAFHTTAESRRAVQPYVSISGAVLTWDGRLDNRADLIRESGGLLSDDASDVSIVAVTYDRRGVRSFADLVGDWALSVWSPRDHSVVLAKDPIGTRQLYYSFGKNQLTWCTVLEPLVLCAGKQFLLDEEYLAGWISSFPATDRTPYLGIHSVSPSYWVRIQPTKQALGKYWDFDSCKKIRYRTDLEYEEHFRAVFRESVRRRLRSDAPILAELSGGMDSSSIVCMADTIIAHRAEEVPRLDTVSYFNELEPNWNERPYFEKVEDQRGRLGCHIDLSGGDTFKLDFSNERFALAPGPSGSGTVAAQRFAALIASQGNRVVLSGTGGDEVMGGVPTPLPELQDLLARARFLELAGRLKAWALDKRKPWFHLLSQASCDFFPLDLRNEKPTSLVPWLHPSFVRKHREALTGHETRLKLFGPLPSFQNSIRTLQGLRRNLACVPLSSDPPYEKRYPYLDRHLLEFLYAIPRSQLIRPGHRRSLMRRALAGTIPEEILNRKRKAFVARAPMAAISDQWARFVEIDKQTITSFEIVERKHLLEAIENVRKGQKTPILILLRTLALELWLQSAIDRGVIAGPTAEDGARTISLGRTERARVLLSSERSQLASCGTRTPEKKGGEDHELR